MHLIKENDVYKRESEKRFDQEEIITFKYFSKPELKVFKRHNYDWYIAIALEKADKVKEDRHLLTADLLIEYRWAIREGFNHMLDSNLKNRYDEPRNRNTVNGIKSYIANIKKKSDAEMAELNV